MHAPGRIKPLRLKSVAVAPKALVLNRACFKSAVYVRAARLGEPVFDWVKLNSVQPKVIEYSVRNGVDCEASNTHVRGAASWLSDELDRVQNKLTSRVKCFVQ